MPWIRVKLDDGTEVDAHVTMAKRGAAITQRDIDALSEMARALHRAKQQPIPPAYLGYTIRRSFP